MAPEDSETETPPEAERQSASRIVGDIALSEGLAATRGALEKRLARQGYAKKDIERIVAGKAGFGTRFAAAAIARLATRSVPGALLVGGGLVAKALFDRRRTRKQETPTVDEGSE